MTVTLSQSCHGGTRGGGVAGWCVSRWYPVVRVRVPFPTVFPTVTSLWPHWDPFCPHCGLTGTLFCPHSGLILPHFGLILACFWPVFDQNGPLFRPKSTNFRENLEIYPFSSLFSGFRCLSNVVSQTLIQS